MFCKKHKFKASFLTFVLFNFIMLNGCTQNRIIFLDQGLLDLFQSIHIRGEQTFIDSSGKNRITFNFSPIDTNVFKRGSGVDSPPDGLEYSFTIYSKSFSGYTIRNTVYVSKYYKKNDTLTNWGITLSEFSSGCNDMTTIYMRDTIFLSKYKIDNYLELKNQFTGLKNKESLQIETMYITKKDGIIGFSTTNNNFFIDSIIMNQQSISKIN